MLQPLSCKKITFRKNNNAWGSEELWKPKFKEKKKAEIRNYPLNSLEKL